MKEARVPELEEAAFSAPLNKVVSCKTKFGFHLLQVLSESTQASLSGFKVLPLGQFGSWAADIATKFDPQKDTYVLCHPGVRSLQVAKWLQTQGFKRSFNVSGGIHAYAVKANPSVPTY
ncbi:hypothetical protein GIB67_019909 [Kingdonia uniflora]|uniref:Rhodanese domain-containing protein n=1 Tax=Kingdonia uniflora TaxID=39325 RepID=A0A7J7MKH3_9MAGN|nr:hypothetical protein GIB67_019909 [Kingdonia uniflora]